MQHAPHPHHLALASCCGASMQQIGSAIPCTDAAGLVKKLRPGCAHLGSAPSSQGYKATWPALAVGQRESPAGGSWLLRSWCRSGQGTLFLGVIDCMAAVCLGHYELQLPSSHYEPGCSQPRGHECQHETQHVPAAAAHSRNRGGVQQAAKVAA